MGRFALRAANLLVGNAEGAAVLEAVFLGPELEFTAPTTVAITGGDLPPKLNGDARATWEAFPVKAGDRLSFGYLKSGARIYIAVSECCFGALTSGDVELLEYSYPIIIHRYSLMTDSGGAGKNRGGSGTAWEVEPLNDDLTFITFGEGRRIPAVGAAGVALSAVRRARAGAVGWLGVHRNA